MFSWNLRITMAVLASSGGPTLAQSNTPYERYEIQRIGLYGSDQTDAAGLQRSVISFIVDPRFVLGRSDRYRGVALDNGRDLWVWNGQTTTQLGLTGNEYTGSTGYQVSDVEFHNLSGFVAGTSQRFAGVNTSIGQSVWSWNGGSTTRLGLTDAEYTGSTGFQYSRIVGLSASGQVAGYSQRVTNVSTSNGSDAWIWDGSATTRIGLAGVGYTGSSGYRNSQPRFQNASGQVSGFSSRVSEVRTNLGSDAWVWNGVATVQIGLLGSGYTSDTGFQASSPELQNDAGQVVGLSYRIGPANETFGQDAWVWNGTATTQIGLIGGAFTSSDGVRSSTPLLQNAAGQVAGISLRYPRGTFSDSTASWVWNGNTTTQIGLIGAAYTGSQGFQSSRPYLQNAAGQVTGLSWQIQGVDSTLACDTWVWNGGTSTPINPTTGAFTGSAGNRSSSPRFQNEIGHVVGYSDRYVNVTGSGGDPWTSNGRAVWSWNGATTTEISLTGATYTGSAGYRWNDVVAQNADGSVVGWSQRITGERGFNGNDAWYFDPSTGVTTAVIGSTRNGDNYSYSLPTRLTDGGFMLGNYMFFAEGSTVGERRAFIFRPDFGFTDLGELVDNGLTANGWTRLANPAFAEALSTIIGYGYVNGQSGGLSVFVMTVPSPGSAVVLSFGLVVAGRRARCVNE